MASLIFFYDNFWDDQTLDATNEHSNFPVENTQHRDFNKSWRSNYGAGSSWGRFIVTAGVNDKIDFTDEVGIKAATVAPAVYNADTLAAAIEVALEAVSVNNFTGSYLESGADANKFKIRCETRAIDINWNTGANKATSIAGTIGFDDSADDLAAQDFVADYIRIHTLEYVYFVRDAQLNVYGVMIRGHNFQDTAEVYVQGSNDNFATTPLNQALTIQDDILIYRWSSVQQYQDWRIIIYDRDNPAGFVEMGRIYIGGQFQPTKHFAYNRTITQGDPSLIKESEDGQVASIQRSHFQTWQYRFQGTNQKSSFDAMFDDMGFSKSLFICEDPDIPLTTTFYVMFRSWSWEHLFDSYYNLSLATREER